MKIFVSLMILFYLVLVIGCSSPQMSTHNLTYKIVDHKGTPQSYALVNLSIRSAPGIFQYGYTDENGHIILRLQGSTIYSLQISNLSNGITYQTPNFVFPDSDGEDIIYIDFKQDNSTPTPTLTQDNRLECKRGFLDKGFGGFVRLISDPLFGCK